MLSFFNILNLQDYLLHEINHNMFHFQIKLLRMIYVFTTAQNEQHKEEMEEEREEKIVSEKEKKLRIKLSIGISAENSIVNEH